MIQIEIWYHHLEPYLKYSVFIDFLEVVDKMCADVSLLNLVDYENSNFMKVFQMCLVCEIEGQ